MTVVQKTIIDTLNQESKTPKVIAKETGCFRSGYLSKLLESRMEGKHEVEFSKTNSMRTGQKVCSVVHVHTEFKPSSLRFKEINT